jgi:hypothetical protein
MASQVGKQSATAIRKDPRDGLEEALPVTDTFPGERGSELGLEEGRGERDVEGSQAGGQLVRTGLPKDQGHEARRPGPPGS